MARARALYPAVLDLADARVVVVGGGVVALRKARGLPPGTGSVRVVAPEVAPALAAWAKRRGATVLRRAFRAADLDGARLVLCCAGPPAVNAAAARAARARGAWVCQGGEASEGDLLVPAVARAGALRLTVSTSGASPSFAKALRRRLERDLRASNAPWLLARLAALRPRLKAERGLGRAVRRSLAAPETLRLALAPASARARAALARRLDP